ncbi:PHP domain-containing protein [Nocardioides ferulae]|uniref:PHP domain-containing protein n=1 Tax=Nocardioides ferulae TaxID=2340821 RepID=UPI000EAD2016|nr:PHP domain-containing protein [Nocardioides ferulae]
MRIDLHSHSRASDGTDAPGDLVRAAAAAGLDVLAITDHDTAEGWAEAAEAAGETGVELVRGMEISARHEGHAVHLLAYLPDPTYPPLVAELERVLQGRRARVPTMLERLRALGLELSEAEVVRAGHDTAATGRPHVADAMVHRGLVRDRDEAFTRYLGAGRPAYVERYAAPLVETLRLVTEAGGVSVIAHPWGRSGRRRPDEADLAELAEAGLVGVEVDHQDHSPQARAELRAITRNLGLVLTGSSDYHGDGKRDHELGCNTTSAEDYQRLIELAAAAADASSCATPEVLRS